MRKSISAGDIFLHLVQANQELDSAFNFNIKKKLENLSTRDKEHVFATIITKS